MKNKFKGRIYPFFKKIPRVLRVRSPVTDGYSIILHTDQRFFIRVPALKDSNIDNNDRIVLDSDFISLSHSTETALKSKDVLNHIIDYHFYQKFDLSRWTKESSVFLGEINVNSFGKEYVRCGIYLMANDKRNYNKVTVINPKNQLVKVRYNDLLKVVLYNNSILDANFKCKCIKSLPNSVNVFRKLDEIIVGGNDDKTGKICYSRDIEVFKDYTRINSPVRTLEKHVNFQIVAQDINKLNDKSSTTDGNVMETIGCATNEHHHIKDVGFLKLLVVARSKSLSIDPLDEDAYSKRVWDEENRILINPRREDDVVLYEPDFEFLVEISQPSIIDRLVFIDDNLSWSLTPYSENDKKFTIYNLTPSVCPLPNGKIIKVQRFRVVANISAVAKTRTFFGSLALRCNGHVRRLSVDTAPYIQVNYQERHCCNIKGQSHYQHSGNSYYKPDKHDYYVAKVNISKLGGGLDKGISLIDIRNLYNITNKDSSLNTVGTKTNVIVHNPKPKIPDQVQQDLSVVEINDVRRMDSVCLKPGTRLRVKLKNTYINAEAAQKGLYTCNVMQKKLMIVSDISTVQIIGSEVEQVFEFTLFSKNLPTVNKTPYYIGSIKFMAYDTQTTHHIVRYLHVNITHVSTYDKKNNFSKDYTINSLVEGHVSHKKNKPIISVRSDDKKGSTGRELHISNWSNNDAIILSDLDTVLYLPNDEKNIKWYVNVKQYPIPKKIWNELNCEGVVDRDEPWWPDEMFPEHTFGGIRIPKLSKYQPLLCTIMEKYSEYYKLLSFPLAKIVFNTDVIVQNREIGGTLLKVRQKYYKTVYLHGYDYSDCLLGEHQPNDNLVELKYNYNNQSIVLKPKNELFVHLNNVNMWPMVVPHWMRLLKSEFSENANKYFTLIINEKDFNKQHIDYRLNPEGYVVFHDSLSNEFSAKVSVDMDVDEAY